MRDQSILIMCPVSVWYLEERLSEMSYTVQVIGPAQGHYQLCLNFSSPPLKDIIVSDLLTGRP
jgi:hypothetical protein